MLIEILTLFPKMFEGPFSDSLMARAQKKKLVQIKLYDLRKFGEGFRKTIDDRPYGGGVGMIMKVTVIEKALKKLLHPTINPFGLRTKKAHVILLTPRGKKFNQQKALELSKKKHIVLISGRYEGFDERIHEYLVNEELSIGDFVMMGGELPAMVITETVVRLIPKVIKKEEATKFESFSDPKLLEAPQYTRPDSYKGWKVPEVLLTGDHKKIEEWKQKEAKKVTLKNRPDLVIH